jgi:hypothetical protein
MKKKKHLHSGHIMKAHFSNLKVINYHPAGNRVHDQQEALESDAPEDLDEDLTELLSQQTSLLTRTVRPLGDLNWENDHRNRTRARFADSEGEEIEYDPPTEKISTQQRDPIPDAPLLFGELQEELPIQEQIDQERSNELDQDVLAQFVVELKELKDERNDERPNSSRKRI